MPRAPMLPGGLIRTGLRDLLRRPLHSALMVFGIALGVAVVVAVDLANQSARTSFERSARAVVGRATHGIVAGSGGVPVSLLARLRRDVDAPPLAPIVEGHVVLVGPPSQTLRVLGLDPFSESGFREALAGASWADPGFARLLTEPGAIVLGGATARRRDLPPGSSARVRVADRLETLRVVGVFETPGADDAGFDDLAIMDVGQAQRLFRLGDRVSRIDLALDDDAAARIAGMLDPGQSLVSAHAQARTAAQLSEAFQLNLTALSLLALLVGLFLIYNTVTFSVVQRRPVFATLRALGVTPRELLALVLVEALVASLVGAALGVGLGFVLGHGVVHLVTRTINDFYYVLAVRDVSLHAGSVLRGVLLGLGTGLLAAYVPAVEASRVSPVTALRPSSLETSARRRLPRLAAGALVLLALAGGLLWAFERPLVLSFAGLFGIVLGLALLSPHFSLALMALLGPAVSRVLGTPGRIATRTVGRALSRTGVAIAALMVAVSVTIGVGLMIGSFRDTVDNWLELSLVADIYVSAPSGAARSAGTLSPDVEDRVVEVSGVAEVETYRAVRVRSDRGEISLGVSDARRTRSAALYRFAEGDPEQTWARMRSGAVVVSEPFAERHDLPEQGTVLRIETDHGPRLFPVVGVFYDYATEEGVVLMSRSVYDSHFDDRQISSLAVTLEPGAASEGVLAAIRAALADREVLVRSNAALRQRALDVFDRTFAVTGALRVLAVIVAFIGVWSALMSLQLERTRELATLRALGMTSRELGGVTLLETGLMGLAAGLLSVPTGMLLARVLVDVINVRSFGWSMRLQYDPTLLLQAVLLSVAAALLASAYPLWRLSRLPLAAALRQE